MTTKANRLYWDVRGRICCGEHAPYVGTDTWEFDQWHAVPFEAFEQWRHTGKEMGLEGSMKCETCGKHDERDGR